MEFFEVNVAYRAIDENTGKEKKVKECYLIDAVIFGEAESIATSQIEGYCENIIRSIKRSNITELINIYENETFFKSKVQFLDVDNSTGKEEKVNQYVLVSACDAESAIETIEAELNSLVTPYEIVQVAKSPITEVICAEKGE